MAAMLAASPKPKPSPGPLGSPSAGKSSPPLYRRPLPDRSALNAAERAVSAARERLVHDLDAIAQERAQLDAQEKRTRREGEAQARRLDRVAAAAERAYVAAGGKPANQSA